MFVTRWVHVNAHENLILDHTHTHTHTPYIYIERGRDPWERENKGRKQLGKYGGFSSMHSFFEAQWRGSSRHLGVSYLMMRRKIMRLSTNLPLFFSFRASIHCVLFLVNYRSMQDHWQNCLELEFDYCRTKLDIGHDGYQLASWAMPLLFNRYPISSGM